MTHKALALVALLSLSACGDRSLATEPPKNYAAPQALPVVDVVADPRVPLATLSRDLLGANELIGSHASSNTAYLPRLRKTGIGLIHWPGGGDADIYHWSTNQWSSCQRWYERPPFASAAFDRWYARVVRPLNVHVSIVVNYGSSADCTSGGDPAEAAAWVAHANGTLGAGVRYWTIGNQQYRRSSQDSWRGPHDAREYASRVARFYYPEMKRADPQALIGVDVAYGNFRLDTDADGWDRTVLARAKYDFVELHNYAFRNDTADDRALLEDGPKRLRAIFSTARALIARAGHPPVPLVLGEYDGDNGGSAPQHQSVSIVDALYNAMVVGEMADAGVVAGSMWIGIDNCYPDPPNPTASYGWQHFGSQGLIAMYTSPRTGCGRFVPPGTIFPKGRVLEMASRFITDGGLALPVRIGGSTGVRAYAASSRSGYAFWLIDTDEHRSFSARLSVRGAAGERYRAMLSRYDKVIYDRTQKGRWDRPLTIDLGRVALPATIELTPWSLTLVEFTRSRP